MNKALLSLAVIVLASPSPAAESVTFKQLQAGVRLSHGTTITVEGKFSEVMIEGSPLDAVLEVESVGATAVVSGLADTTFDGSISQDRWNVTVGPFPENAVLTLVLSFKGSIKAAYAKGVADRIIASPEYQTAVELLFTASKKSAGDIKAAIETFATSATDALRAALPPNLRAAEDDKELADTFRFVAQSDVLPAFANLQENMSDLAKHILSADLTLDSPVPTSGSFINPDQAQAAVRQIREKHSSALTNNEDLSDAVTLFQANYDAIASIIQQNVKARIEFERNLSAQNEIKDFEKYGGVDVGAVYVPWVDELRSFATINIYFGAVEEKPASAAVVTSEGVRKKSYLKPFQQRTSLTLGVSMGDLSGRSDDDKFVNNQGTRISGDNAFVYGLGFRVNRYFRISAGASVFRNSIDNQLKHAFYIGPSIDLTGFDYLRGLFAKRR